MLDRISALLYRLSSPVTILIAIGLYVFFLSQVMTPQSQDVALYAGEWGSPDGHFFYTPDELYAQISAWGDEGRAHYIQFRLGLDPVWALVYASFLFTITSVALRVARLDASSVRLLNLAGLVPMLADLVENALGIALMTAYPARIDWLAWLTTSVSGFKWITLGIAHLVLIYAVAMAIRMAIRSRLSSRARRR